jgi:acyl-CoA reductase-like NAD-dependent aldehyde dehydrogenase
VIRWGQPYTSLDVQEVSHFLTGEPLARVSQANPGLLVRDMKQAQRARDVLREVPIRELCAMLARAAELFLHADLPIGDGSQSPEAYCELLSASTGLPANMARANMQKNAFVMQHMDRVLESLTRGMDLDTLTRGYGLQELSAGGRVMLSYQAQTPVLGMVLPNNSPGVHTLWIPAIAMQIGLVLKPGSAEPWTPYRITAAMTQAGVPRQAIGLYPGGHDMGPEVVNRCARSMVFGGQPTVDQYAGNPRVQAHGPGYSKVILGDDLVDDWESHLDLMVESVLSNGGRSCINCSSIWASRHTREIASALAQRLGPVPVTPPTDPEARLAAFTTKSVAVGVHELIEDRLRTPGAEDLSLRFGPRLVEMERCAYLRPRVVHCDSPEHPLANTEFMFPFVSVVRCPQERMIERLGPTLVCTALTRDAGWSQRLIEATHVDRLNLGAIPTQKLDWLQPHEGNIVDFLFRQRALQATPAALEALARPTPTPAPTMA